MKTCNEMISFNEEMRCYFSNHAMYAEKRIVPGEGLCPHPKLALIGEAPGKFEALQGKPFVGKAGENLSAFLKKIGLYREDIYISNVVKIRPFVVGAKGTERNRAPKKEEIFDFLPWLLKELNIVQPKIIVALGNTPLQALLGEKQTVGTMHGKQVFCECLQRNVFSLYHPAALIYNRKLVKQMDSDLLVLKNILDTLR